MADLLTPEEVRDIKSSTSGPFREMNRVHIRCLCCDYLTLWDRNIELEKAQAMALQIIEATEKLRAENELDD